jgi:hypothetical protein
LAPHAREHLPPSPTTYGLCPPMRAGGGDGLEGRRWYWSPPEPS